MPISLETLEFSIDTLVKMREKDGFSVYDEDVTGSYNLVLRANEKFVLYTRAIAELELYKKENYK